ncbi:hypothetical protein EBU91_00060 [bacterium]|nr:hypothetical protein [bacterium]
MTYDYEQQKILNSKSLAEPRIGDYWQERFCPYFLVVDVKGKDITVLSCLGGPNSFTRKHELNAKIHLDKDHWTWDLSKSIVVDRNWMAKAVKYGTNDGFVADVWNSEKTTKMAMEWRDWKQKEIRKQIADLEKKFNDFTGWGVLKGELA